ncbi:uncharacterized protein PGTG_20871 [Puccinia graminis f. sp. tritici CRL 75-36-700-3]|uniref:Uncharacterized protein n=1 Tax=Puccinia graminis f. sp. tritici (strain CRL 75-36-700-3 / race SCCL) TaxID=418459 RepID=H6QPK4_PUCGT|nr:uncharacterized protein PGTG_20871 [Puccinia graminis f. sp. tritici CRL 75-36-700-3]EHS63889.1 hypothetical protein PGTG_20871 [Puccinia graminis f. sp. tritici CRL 75-36-700-3]
MSRKASIQATNRRQTARTLWEDLQVDGYIRFYPYGIEVNLTVSSKDTCFTYRRFIPYPHTH